MNKLKLFYIVLSVFLILSSCSTDDDSDLYEESIIGKWTLISQTNFCSTGSQEIWNSNSCQQTGKLEIKVDGTYSQTFYEIQNDECNLVGTSSGSWELSNNFLTINTSQNRSDELNIILLEENVLKLGSDVNTSNSASCDNGVLTNYTLDFERVE